MRPLYWLTTYTRILFGSLWTEIFRCHEYASFMADISTRKRLP